MRRAGESRALVVLHHGDALLPELRIPLAANPGLSPEDLAALRNGASLDDRLALWGDARARIEDGELVVSMPARSLAVLTLADAPARGR
jgi:hypothetical protein